MKFRLRLPQTLRARLTLGFLLLLLASASLVTLILARQTAHSELASQERLGASLIHTIAPALQGMIGGDDVYTLNGYISRAATDRAIGAVRVTDASNAAVTGLVHGDGSGWAAHILAALNIPASVLPAIVDSSGPMGVASALPGSPPITGMAGDQQASLIGQSCVQPGQAKITFGTGGMLDMVTGPDRPGFEARGGGGCFPIIAWRRDGAITWGVEAVMLSAGSAVEWLRDDMGLIASAAESEAVAAGADEICFLDISAAPEGRATLLDVVERTASRVFIPLTVGGGIRTADDVQVMLRAGADKVSVNSSALARPELIGELADVFGSQCVVVAIDAKRRAAAWDVYVAGGRTRVEGRETVAWAREAAERGAGEILLTSMDRDGTSDGYDLELTRAVAEAVPIPVIASGGAGELDHLVAGISEGQADAVLVASIFHYGKHTVREAKETMRAAGIPVRL